MDTIAEAKTLFNETWDLMDKQDRTPEDDALMLHKAHASCYLWKSANKPVNNARGEWQVSRAYAVLGFGAPAMLHARRSLDICIENGISDFDLTFGYEAVSRAYWKLGDEENMMKYKQLAVESLTDVQDKDDIAFVTEQVNSVGVTY